MTIYTNYISGYVMVDSSALLAETKTEAEIETPVMLHPAALLTAEEARAADHAAIAFGMRSETLMENAGKAVVDIVCQHFAPCPTLVVCGHGNNGGDGFVVARLLKERGWPAVPVLVGESEKTTHDLERAMDQWRNTGGIIRIFSPGMLAEAALVIDGIFGTGLSREVEGEAKEAIDAINASKLPVVAIDIASGINTDNGTIMGAATRAVHTVTFVRPKLGHVLLPGKAHTGELHVYDIGITGEGVGSAYFLNAPSLWKKSFPFPAPDANKYTRGHAIVMGGALATTGAARLAALGALRSGAGLVSIACSQDALPVYAMTLTAVMTKPIDKPNKLAALLDDKRVTATLIGPGYGTGEATREQTLQILSHKKPCVIDADAISVFEANPKPLFAAIAGPTVLTPHEGEFERLFNAKGSKPQRVIKAAKQSGAVVLLKGNDTVIAAPDGRVAVNANAPVWLATAGSGDVLAGIITGLLAQGMPAFEAACAGAWIHGEAATQFGPGLIAEDLPAALAPVLKTLYG